MQSNKNKTNLIYIKKEHFNNIIELFYKIISIVFFLIILLFASISSFIGLVIYSSIFIIFLILRLIINIKLIISFNKLVHKVSPEHIEFYITKSWTRKREASLWIGIMDIFTAVFFMSLVALFTTFINEISVLTLFLIPTIHIFVIIIMITVRIQTYESSIKISEKRLNTKSMEWIQIRKDQSNYYKQLTVWYIHLLLIVPLLLMLIPSYREIWNKI